MAVVKVGGFTVCAAAHDRSRKIGLAAGEAEITITVWTNDVGTSRVLGDWDTTVRARFRVPVQQLLSLRVTGLALRLIFFAGYVIPVRLAMNRAESQPTGATVPSVRLFYR